eukprot:gnl/TRDRNA2_/TRDRNA2_174641_c0_seq1.p2 gnl/TRDRNA2_/TRDRNA2_174641_c0~~gnl/TRDRNA2_/TRDRNA2_174641_c0_seq1.p2  ORF type:complete len:100 (-),score=12.08 gnl/TRDRNA2_/TRDRNA2_174641_c0_seq1:236-535(-)
MDPTGANMWNKLCVNGPSQQGKLGQKRSESKRTRSKSRHQKFMDATKDKVGSQSDAGQGSIPIRRTNSDHWDTLADHLGLKDIKILKALEGLRPSPNRR